MALDDGSTAALTHELCRVKLSPQPNFVPKPRNVVGLYVDPPAHTVVLSVDEKLHIQVADRTQSGLAVKLLHAAPLA